MDNKRFKYDFFISYKHGKLDSEIASYLQQQLEHYKVPKDIRQKSKKDRISRVFRDESELSASSDLSKDIEGRLADSEFLIVICSPDTKNSRWVDQEIRTFIKHRDRRNILPVLIKGEPEDSFPEILMETEPMAADFRGNDLSFIKKRCRTELLRLVSPALHCSYDELKQRHKAYQFRKIAITASVITTVAVLFSAYSIYQNVQIKKNYEEKQIRQAKLLADKSSQLLKEGDKEASVLIAMEALPKGDKDDMPFVGEAQIALENALALYTLPDQDGYRANRILQMENESDLRYTLNEEKRILVTFDYENNVYFWNLDQESLITTYTLPADAYFPDVYIGKNDCAYICHSGEIICFNYNSNKEVWKMSLIEQEIFYQKAALSPDGDKILCVGGNTYYEAEGNRHTVNWAYLDAATGEYLQKGEMPDNAEHKCDISSLIWSPDNNRACVGYNNSTGITNLCVINHEKNEAKMMAEVVQDDYSTPMCYFADEDTLIYQGVPESTMSMNVVYMMTDYFVQGYDISSMKKLWEVKSAAPARDTRAQIQCSEITTEDGEKKDLITVSIYSQIINIVDGEIISEASYPNEIAGVFNEGDRQFHLTDDGVFHEIKTLNGTAYNEFYGNTDLGMKNIIVARSYSDSEVFVLQENSSNIYLLNQAYDDTGIMLEDSALLSGRTVYDESGEYIAGVKTDYDTKKEQIYLWESSSGKVLFKDEITLEEDERDNFAPAFIGSKYFYYATTKRVFLYSLETKKLLATYSIDQAEIIETKIEKVESYQKKTPSLFLCSANGTIVQLQGESLEPKLLATENDMKVLFDENGETTASFSYNFWVSPDEKYLAVQRYEYLERENVYPIVFFDLENKVLAEIPAITLCKDIALENLVFSEDGTKVVVYTNDQQLKVIDLESAKEIHSMEIDGDSYHKFWLSEDNQKLFVHAGDHLLKIYDLKENTFIMNSDDVPYDIVSWEFFEEGKYLMTLSETTLSYPMCTFFYQKKDGSYESFSQQGTCVDASLNQYMVDSSTTETYVYKRLSLDEILEKAKEYLNGRTLTELERQKYHIDN